MSERRPMIGEIVGYAIGATEITVRCPVCRAKFVAKSIEHVIESDGRERAVVLKDCLMTEATQMPCAIHSRGVFLAYDVDVKQDIKPIRYSPPEMLEYFFRALNEYYGDE